MSIRANPDGKVIGTVIEAELDKSKGPLATLLVQNGTLTVGDIVIAGNAWGKLKAMFDFRLHNIRKAGPSTPVSVMGLSEVPSAGDIFQVFASEKEARAIVNGKIQAADKGGTMPKQAITLEQLFSQIQAGEINELRLVVKADVQGSLEPVVNSIKELSTDKTRINILHAETGNIGENDVMLASASKAIVIGFNVQADAGTHRLADTERVSIRTYDIIYRLLEDIEKALKGMLEPVERETVLGHAEVRQLFRISKIGFIAGCRVTDGELRRNAHMRVLRNKELVNEGEISSLKHLQEDAREVRQGFDCGVALKGFNDYQVGDILECYIREKVLI
jgi:translation initiation factor IF-2